MSIWPQAEDTQQLLAEARQGSADAVDRLLDRHRRAVHRLIELRMDRRLGRRVDASDIVQEVMIDAHRRLQTYLDGPPLPFHLWLRQIAKDRLIDAHRRHRVAARRSMDREQPLVAGGSNTSSVEMRQWLRDPEHTPASAAVLRELYERFTECCDQMDEVDQEIVFMRHSEQLSNGEAAEALGLTPQAASMRYLRALRRLRALLSGESGENEPDP